MNFDFLKKISKETIKKIIIYILIVIGGFVLDRLTKEIVADKLVLNKLSQIEIIPNFLYFSYVENTGGAWSILNNATWLLAVFSAVATIGITIYMFKKKININYFISGSLIVSGGLGNLYDRVLYGAVIDFIETYPLGYSFPIFNVADIFVVCGAFYMIIYMFVEEYLEKRKSREKIINENDL